MSLLLSFLMVLCLGSTAVAEVDPVGMVGGNLYINEALGLCVVLPDSWSFLTDADLAKQMGYDSQYASREGLAALLQRDSLVCAMFACASNDAAYNMNLMVAEMGMYRYLDEQTLMSLSENGCVEALQGQGYSNVQLTEGTFQLAGAAHAGAVLTGELGALQIYMIVVLVKGEQYMGTVTIAASSKDKAEKALGFYVPLSGTTAGSSSGGNQDAEAKKVHDQIADAIARSDWSGALSLLNGQYGDSYPDYANVVKNCQNHLDYNNAKKAMDSKLYYTAYQLFSSLGNFENAKEQARLCLRPTPNSEELSRNSAYSKKSVRLNLTNGLSNYYAYVRIYNSAGNIVVSNIFIHPGKTVAVYLPDDTFLFKVAYGRGNWFGEEEMFGDDGIYKEMFTQALQKTGRGWYYCTFDDVMDYDTVSREDF